MTWGFPISSTHAEKSSISLSDSRDIKSSSRWYCSSLTCGLRSWIPLNQIDEMSICNNKLEVEALTVSHVHGMPGQST